MIRLIARLVLTALGVMLVAYLVPGVAVTSFWIALIAALIIGLVNSLVRPVLQVLALPITVLTLGLFSLIVNAACFGLAAWLVPGFSVAGFGPAFWGALALAIYGWLINVLISDNP